MLEEAGLRPFWTEVQSSFIAYGWGGWVANGFSQLNIPHVNIGNSPDVAEVSVPLQIKYFSLFSPSLVIVVLHQHQRPSRFDN